MMHCCYMLCLPRDLTHSWFRSLRKPSIVW